MLAAARELARAQAAKPVTLAGSSPRGAPAPVSREQIAADVSRALRSPTTPINKPTSFVGQVEN